MKILNYKTTIIFIFISLFVFLIGQQQVQAQQEKHLNLNHIRERLASKSRGSKTTKEINEQLIADIRKRGVNFHLTSKDKNSLKKAGGSNLLIKTIRENLSKNFKEQTLLYQKFVDNYDGTIEQKKIAIEAAKEFVKKFSDDEDVKEVIDYLNTAIPDLEYVIANKGNYR